MKIQVVIEATSIQEYTEAIQALAAGYTVQTPVLNVTAGSQESAAAVETEEKPKRRTTTKKEAQKPAEEPKEEKKVEAEEKTGPAKTEQSTEGVSFVDVKLKAKQLANLPDGKSDVKFILEKLEVKKLSDLTEEQYASFMEMAEEAMNVPKTTETQSEEPVETEDKTVSTETPDTKEATIEMIRGKAKELSVAGYKEDIKGLLKEFGAAALTKIPKDKYGEFYAAMERIG